MKLPVIPLAVAGTLVAVVLFLFNAASSGHKKLGAPNLEILLDLEGDETEMAIAPDGTRLLAVASGDLWLINLADRSRKRLTNTTESESFPAWAPDGNRVTFTRGQDTFISTGPDFSSDHLFKENATSLSWAATGRMAFVRDRALWVTDAGGINERLLVEADSNPETAIINPRFSPDSLQISYIRTNLGLQGEVWTVDATTGAAGSLVADRWAENPLDTGWMDDGRKLVYLTNRSGAYALWIIDLGANTLGPLTNPLDGIQLARTGIATWQDHIYVARHFVNSDIVSSDGTVVAQSPAAEFEPAASPDGKQVAYTVQNGNNSEIWTADVDGSNPVFRTLGMQPRFSPGGFELVYTHTDLEGHVDLRKLDIRDGSSESMTDAGEIDFEPDWSPDGRSVAFSSGKTGTMALWTVPAVGGKRTHFNDSGYFPRFSPDGRSLAYWSHGALWTAPISGGTPRRVREDVARPTPPVWVKGTPKIYSDPEIAMGKEILPAVDVSPDGRLLTAVVTQKASAIWTVTLTYVDE